MKGAGCPKEITNQKYIGELVCISQKEKLKVILNRLVSV